MSWGTVSPPPKQADCSGLSKETQALLDDVMQRRGLSLRAMQDVSSSIRRGDSSWADHLSSSSSTFKQPGSKLNASVKVPRFTSGSRQMQAPSGPPTSFSGKRMVTTPAERDMWVGSAPGPDRDAEKDRLSKVMEVGGAKALKERERQEEQARVEAARRAARSKNVDMREELVNQIVAELQERREFLEDMQKAGKAAQYEAVIKSEIAARMHELDRLGIDVHSSRPPHPSAART